MRGVNICHMTGDLSAIRSHPARAKRGTQTRVVRRVGSVQTGDVAAADQHYGCGRHDAAQVSSGEWWVAACGRVIWSCAVRRLVEFLVSFDFGGPVGFLLV